jgi:hypothetical protein
MMRVCAGAAQGGPTGWLHSVRIRPRSRALPLVSLALALLFPSRAPAQTCVGDCDSGGQVTVDEILTMVNIALGDTSISACDAGDTNGDNQITIDEILTAVNNALRGCLLPIATSTPTDTAAASATPETPTPTPTASQTPGNGAVSVAEAVARDAQGNALHFGQSLTTEGVVTVTAGLFANNKLKIFIQSGGAGIMVYRQTSVGTFQEGDLLQATGVIRQADPTGGDNLAEGTVLVDITNGAATVLSTGNPLPDPSSATLDQLVANGVALTGTLVHVPSVHKINGAWPQLGDKTTQVTVGDDSGTTIVVRFQRPTITQDLADALEAIGNGTLALTGIVVQDDRNTSDGLLSGYELWPRGAEDIAAAP